MAADDIITISLTVTKGEAALVAAACLNMAQSEDAPDEAVGSLNGVCDKILDQIGAV